MPWLSRGFRDINVERLLGRTRLNVFRHIAEIAEICATIVADARDSAGI